MNYPHRNEQEAASLERLPQTMFAEDDKPFLATQRYSLSPDYEPADVAAKQQVDTHGTMDNQYWLNVWKERGL